jgi:hypothetical protein
VGKTSTLTRVGDIAQACARDGSGGAVWKLAFVRPTRPLELPLTHNQQTLGLT